MSDFVLAVESRNLKEARPAKLRRTGKIPAVVYGHGVATVPISVDARALQKIWKAAGESSLIDLKIGETASVKVIIQDVQFDPATSRILHADFHQVKMTEKLDVDVDLEFMGESPAVKELGGTLLKLRDKVKVECLPADLVKSITVDISALATFDHALHMRDLILPKGLTLKELPDDGVAQVEPPRTDEELSALNETVEEDVSKVEKIEKPVKEDESAADAAVPDEAKPKPS